MTLPPIVMQPKVTASSATEPTPVDSARPPAESTTPSDTIRPTPNRSISTPAKGEKNRETRKPVEKIAAVVPRDQPYSSRIAGKRSEKATRTLAPIAMVMKATASTTQP